MNTRADPLANLDKFEPKMYAERKNLPEQQDIAKLANEHGFASRHDSHTEKQPPKLVRRFKTGRNVQINIKGDLETKSELYSLANQLDQPLGEILKRAMAALRREMNRAE